MKNRSEYGRGDLVALGVVLALAAAGPACSHAPGSPEPMARELSPGQTRVPGEYLVTLVPGTDARIITDVYGRFGIKGIRDLGNGVFLLTITTDPGPAAVDEVRSGSARIKAVQPNFTYRTGGSVNIR